ncbi:GntR family transcriptional regulator [Pseudonocardia sp. HH130630-07]|uniref:GntR family transcriptional regulator n=1 Tax=Pseudonocardia sp. HH130630-07 TaxID=1690815 RepID=UPI000839B919|nr:GntR family transcriptional regulator [Pseudonocardia sp. HH130630-07]
MSRIPRYQVIYQDLSAQIASGSLAPDVQLPSEADLAERYGVSRMTVRQAVRQLQDEQLLVRRRGAGTFVTRPSAQRRRLNRLGSFAQEMGTDETRVRTRLRGHETVAAPEEVRDRLGLGAGQEVIRIERLRLVDDRPAALQVSWLPYAQVPLLARADLSSGSLYRTIREQYGLRLTWADQEVTASAASAEQARALEVRRGAPLIASVRITHDQGSTPVEFARSWTRPEFPLSIRLEG